MERENINLSKITQSQKKTRGMYSYMWILGEKAQNTHYATHRQYESQEKRRPMYR